MASTHPSRLLVIGLGDLGHHICKRLELHARNLYPHHADDYLQTISVQWKAPDTNTLKYVIELAYDTDDVLTQMKGNPPPHIRTWFDIDYWHVRKQSRQLSRPLVRLGWFHAMQAGMSSQPYRIWKNALETLQRIPVTDKKLTTIFVGDLTDNIGSSLLVDAVSFTEYVLGKLENKLQADVWAFTRIPTQGASQDEHRNAYATLRELERWTNSGFYSSISYPIHYSAQQWSAPPPLQTEITDAIFDYWFTFEAEDFRTAVDLANATVTPLLNENTLTTLQSNIVNTKANRDGINASTIHVNTVGVHALVLPFYPLLERFIHQLTTTALHNYLNQLYEASDIRQNIITFWGGRSQSLQGFIADWMEDKTNWSFSRLRLTQHWTTTKKLDDLLFKGFAINKRTPFDYINETFIQPHQHMKTTGDIDVCHNNIQSLLADMVDTKTRSSTWHNTIELSSRFDDTLSLLADHHQTWFVTQLQETLTTQLQNQYSPKYCHAYVQVMKTTLMNHLKMWEELDEKYFSRQIRAQHASYDGFLYAVKNSATQSRFRPNPRVNSKDANEYYDAVQELVGSILSLLYVRMICRILSDYIEYCTQLESTFKTFIESFERIQQSMQSNKTQKQFENTHHTTFVLDTIDSEWFKDRLATYQRDKSSSDIFHHFNWNLSFNFEAMTWGLRLDCANTAWVANPDDTQLQKQVAQLIQLVEDMLPKTEYEVDIVSYMASHATSPQTLRHWLNKLNTAHEPTIRLRHRKAGHSQSSYVVLYEHEVRSEVTAFIDETILLDLHNPVNIRTVANQINKLSVDDDAFRITHLMLIERLDLTTDLIAYTEAKAIYKKTNKRHQYHVFSPEYYASQMDTQQGMWAPQDIFFITDWQDAFLFWVSYYQGLIETCRHPDYHTIYYETTMPSGTWRLTPSNETHTLLTATQAYLSNIHYNHDNKDILSPSIANTIRQDLQTAIEQRIYAIYENIEEDPIQNKTYGDILHQYGIANIKNKSTTCIQTIAEFVFYAKLFHSIVDNTTLDKQLHQLQQAMFDQRVKLLQAKVQKCISSRHYKS